MYDYAAFKNSIEGYRLAHPGATVEDFLPHLMLPSFVDGWSMLSDHLKRGVEQAWATDIDMEGALTLVADAANYAKFLRMRMESVAPNKATLNSLPVGSRILVSLYQSPPFPGSSGSVYMLVIDPDFEVRVQAHFGQPVAVGRVSKIKTGGVSTRIKSPSSAGLIGVELTQIDSSRVGNLDFSSEIEVLFSEFTEKAIAWA
ncbi:hypothetical protein [Streptomyces sp. NPDC047981]|uniref:hypothetical protein n=1 Tax=Streptomyces sp. NPDC047981 TaxID=3154610 RepID=UPI003430D63D